MIDIFLVCLGAVGATGTVAICSYHFGFDAGRRADHGTRIYPEGGGPYVSFPAGMRDLGERLEFLLRMSAYLSDKAESSKYQGATDGAEQPEESADE
ncbi:hypothetical protein LZL36_30670 [Pseudomonas aeruginosa]|nr:hypothetical protein [Pseudomonas aeruginosa]